MNESIVWFLVWQWFVSVAWWPRLGYHGSVDGFRQVLVYRFYYVQMGGFHKIMVKLNLRAILHLSPCRKLNRIFAIRFTLKIERVKTWFACQWHDLLLFLHLLIYQFHQLIILNFHLLFLQKSLLLFSYHRLNSFELIFSLATAHPFLLLSLQDP